MYDKYFLLLQPKTFDKRAKPELKRTILLDDRGYVHMMCEDPLTTKAELKKLEPERPVFITYNGVLLRDMLKNCIGYDYRRIICLMTQFAQYYARANNKIDPRTGELDDTWKTLSFALSYYYPVYYNGDCKVDIYDEYEVMDRTSDLYFAMRKHNEDFERKEIEQ